MAEITTTERLPFPLAKPNPDTFVTKTSEIGHNGQPLDDVLEGFESNINTIDSAINGGTTAITGTFVENGVIATDGSFVANSLFSIYSYAVSEGDSLHIHTELAPDDNRIRAQVAAYNNDTFVAVVSTGNIITDIDYVVPSGVNKICVYNRNGKSQSVILSEGGGLVEDVSNLKARMSSVEGDISDINNNIDPLLPTYEPLTGTFVENGVIATDGSFVANSIFSIYSYAVSKGNSLHIHTELAPDDSRTRAQVAAYNNDTFVAVVSTGNTITDIDYVVPSGVNKICVYNRNGKSQSVDLRTGIDVATDIPYLKGKVTQMEEEINALQEFVDGLNDANEYCKDDFYVDGDDWKSYYYDLNKSIGQTAPVAPYRNNYQNLFGCMKLSVSKGSKILVKTIGGNNGRAYGITDADNKLLVIAPANEDTTSNPFEYKFTQDGFLIVNCTPNTSTAFYVKVWKELSDTLEQIEENTEKINELEEQVGISSVPKINNPAYNLKKQSLKIFHIGNSFMDDSTNYLPGFIEAAGINTADMCLYCGIRSGGSYKNWYDVYHGTDEQNPTIYKKCGGINQTITSDGTIGSAFRSALRDNEWDIIILQQASNYSGEYKQWEGNGEGGYLQELIRIIRLWQPNATIAFNLVHASPSQSGGSTTALTQARWGKIAESCKWMVSNYGIDLIIPYGTAVENIRSSILNTSGNGLTRDNHHLGHGLARYVAAACYFQTVFAPRFGVSVLGNSYRYTVTEQQREEAGTYASGCIDVTNANAETAQMAAMLACNYMYENINPDNVEL